MPIITSVFHNEFRKAADHLVLTRAFLMVGLVEPGNAWIEGPERPSLILKELLGYLGITFEQFREMPSEQLKALYIQGAEKDVAIRAGEPVEQEEPGMLKQLQSESIKQALEDAWSLRCITTPLIVRGVDMSWVDEHYFGPRKGTKEYEEYYKPLPTPTALHDAAEAIGQCYEFAGPANLAKGEEL